MVRDRVKGGQRGMALPLVLVLLLALTFFGNGVLLMARRELQATWAFRHLVRATEAAEMGLRLGMASRPDTARPGTLWEAESILSGETPEGHRYDVVHRRLDGGFFLLESTGRSRGWRGSRVEIWVGWAPYPGYRMRSFLSYHGRASDSGVVVPESGLEGGGAPEPSAGGGAGPIAGGGG